jgi:hypothetical protein
MYNISESTEHDKHLVKLYAITETKSGLMLSFKSLWGWYGGTLNLWVKDDDDPLETFWKDLVGKENPTPEEALDVLKKPLLATVERIKRGKNRPTLTYITKLHSMQ